MDTGYAAWMLTASSIVLMMTAPGLALFYGGLTRSKSVLNMMMMSFSALGIVGVVYVLWGWSMSFSDLWTDAKDFGGFFADPFALFGLKGVAGSDAAASGELIFVAFQLTFAVITA